MSDLSEGVAGGGHPPFIVGPEALSFVHDQFQGVFEEAVEEAFEKLVDENKRLKLQRFGLVASL